VRIVEIDPQFSVELCGGTHVRRTNEIGLFKIISEASIASGIRRIEAVTGEGLNAYIRKRVKMIGDLDAQLEKLMREQETLEKELGKPPSPVASKFEGVTEPIQASRDSLGKIALAEKSRLDAMEAQTKIVHELKKELSKNRVQDASSEIDALVAGGVAVNGFKVVSAKIEVGDAEELKRIGDILRTRITSGVGVLAAVVDEKIAFVCVVTDDLIKDKKLQAGKIVGELARRVGGGGGGRPHLATAGGKDVGKLDETLGQAAEIVKGML
jgi:alanyl-tRNA synthetase